MDRRNFFKTVGGGMLASGTILGVPGIVQPEKVYGSSRGMKLTYEVKKLQLRNTWTIARNSSNFKNNVFE